MRIWSTLMALLLLATGAAAKDYPVNELPLYGGITKSPAMVEADQKFVDAVLQQGFTRAKGSDKAVQSGWESFRKGDLATAIKRFNQAWLLDPDNGDAFHGFAVVVMARDNNAAAADTLFKTGIAKPRQSPGIYLDYGRFLLLAKRPLEAIALLQKALTFPDMGPDAEALLTGAFFEAGDLTAACREAQKVSDKARAPYLKAVESIRGQCPKQP